MMNPERFRRAGVLAIGLALMVIPAEPVLSCSCVGPSGKDALPAVAAMFTGKAVRVEYLEPDAREVEPEILVTFEVFEVWKGPIERTLRLRTKYNKWSCRAYYFKEGHSYLVAAHEVKAQDGEVVLGGVNICGGTSELARAGDALKTLGPGAVPPQKSQS